MFSFLEAFVFETLCILGVLFVYLLRLVAFGVVFVCALLMCCCCFSFLGTFVFETS